MYHITRLSMSLALVLLLAHAQEARAQAPQHHPPGRSAAPQDASQSDTKPPEADAEDGDEEEAAEPARRESRHRQGGARQGMRRQQSAMMMDHGGGHDAGRMVTQHLQHLVRHLKLSDEQRTQARTLVYAHAKRRSGCGRNAIRCRWTSAACRRRNP